MPRKLTSQDFWQNYDKVDGCWIWRGACSHVRFEGDKWMVGKLAFYFVFGSIPTPRIGRGIVHQRCGNTRCINPKHLYMSYWHVVDGKELACSLLAQPVSAYEPA